MTTCESHTGLVRLCMIDGAKQQKSVSLNGHISERSTTSYQIIHIKLQKKHNKCKMLKLELSAPKKSIFDFFKRKKKSTIFQLSEKL